MKLIIDANILVAELTRKRGRVLLAQKNLSLFVAEKPWSEVQHELKKRYLAIAERSEFSQEEALEFVSEATSLAEDLVELIPIAVYEAFEPEAKKRIPRDPDDWHTVALALAFDADIWTQDGDFLGCGVATWTTDTLKAQLGL